MARKKNAGKSTSRGKKSKKVKPLRKKSKKRGVQKPAKKKPVAKKRPARARRSATKKAKPAARVRVNPNIFREYDIRGIVTEDLHADVVERIGKAYGTAMVRKGAGHVTVGRDVRTTSLKLKNALVKGILSTGIHVTDVGEVPTPALYYSIVYAQADGGIMVTGSHNPREYNGFKMCDGLAPIYGEEIQGLKKLIEKKDFAVGKGTAKTLEIEAAYLDMLKSKIRLERPFKIVIDAGNGTAGRIAPEIFRRLGCEVIELYCELDGTFPNHLPDPTKLEYIQDLRQLVLDEKADLGLGFDGDSDRVGAIDEKGRVVFADKLLALLAREITKKSPGAKILFDVKCSQALMEDIQNHGGVPVMYKTGHSLLKAKMKELKNPLAGEMSGHIFFADDFWGYDDAIYVACRLVQMISRSGRSLGQLADSIPAFVSTPEIRVDTTEEDKFRIVDEVREYFRARYSISDVDGVRIQYGDGWGLVRASNTQPVLVVRFEAKTDARLHAIMDEVVSKLREYPSVRINDNDLHIYSA